MSTCSKTQVVCKFIAPTFCSVINSSRSRRRPFPFVLFYFILFLSDYIAHGWTPLLIERPASPVRPIVIVSRFRLRNDLNCVEWDVKPCSTNQSRCSELQQLIDHRTRKLTTNSNDKEVRGKFIGASHGYCRFFNFSGYGIPPE